LKTIVLEEPGRFVRTDTPQPEAPGAGEALVRVHRVGICGTDLHAYRGRQPFFTYPRILGHELGVEVLEAGTDASPIQPGDRCAVEPYLSCGACIACRNGKTNCCVELKIPGVHLDGGMRESMVIPAEKLHRSGSLDYDHLALVEMLGIGAHAVDRASPAPEEWVLVIGAGPIGLSVVRFAQLAGARVIVMEVSPHRAGYCRHRFGVEHVVDGTRDPVAQLREIVPDLPTVVMDATGSAGSMMSAFQYVASGGRMVFVGLVLDDITFADPEFHRREMTLLSTRNATAADFQRIVGLMEAGEIDAGAWISHRAGYGDFVERFPEWLQPDSGVVKAMLAMT
jgi:2-desacetyl-2-hydroxyethyl bacteriochlorophyllide A dehydrogenase